MGIANAFKKALTVSPDPPARERQASPPSVILEEDPRPDLKEDSNLWRVFLTEARKVGEACFEVHHGARCLGLRLIEQDDGTVKFRPLYDEQRGFRSEIEYVQMRDKYLKPHGEHVKEILYKIEAWLETARMEAEKECREELQQPNVKQMTLRDLKRA